MALVLDGPVATEVDGLRRALGDTSLGRMPAHITLVPPVNVRHEDLDEAQGVLRAAAAAQPSRLELTIGPPRTFWPDSPVVYLEVSGDEETGSNLRRLHDAVLRGPLRRSERWPWAPHVTLADDAVPSSIEPCVGCLASYRSATAVDRVVLMEESGHCWAPLADACFGGPRTVGRGGLQLEIFQGHVLGPDLGPLLASEGFESAAGPLAALPSTHLLVLTGRREGTVAGVAVAWLGPPAGSPVQVGVLVAPACRDQGVGRALLQALEVAVGQQGWSTRGAVGHGPERFYQESAAWVTAP